MVINRKLVTQADEDYWEQYKAAPKIFISFASARRVWGNGSPVMTSMRVPADRADEFEKQLLAHLDPAAMGLVFHSLRQEQLAAANNGPVDFGELFVSFSFFLIVAAAMLLAMLLRLSVEQRAWAIGCFVGDRIFNRLAAAHALRGGMMLSIIGGIAGSFLAIGYTWLMMFGLRTWWVDAAGTTAMHLFVSPMTLAIGFAFTLVISLLTILWATWKVRRAVPARLLAGGWEAAEIQRHGGGRGGRIGSIAGSICLLAGVDIIAAGSFRRLDQQIAFLCGGTLLLAGSLCWMASRRS